MSDERIYDGDAAAEAANRLVDENAKLQAALAAERQARQEAEAREVGLRAALEWVEWERPWNHDDPNQCPWCEYYEPEGHGKACRRQLALANHSPRAAQLLAVVEAAVRWDKAKTAFFDFELAHPKWAQEPRSSGLWESGALLESDALTASMNVRAAACAINDAPATEPPK